MRHVVWFLSLIAAGIYITGPLVDPDLWWHITVGRWIVAHGQIPTVDYWSMFGQGIPWRAYSWLAEVPFALADAVSPTHGLLTIKLIIAALLGLTFGATMTAISRDRWFGGLLGIFCAAGCHSHFTLRPQSLTWILLAGILCVADKLSQTNSPTLKKLLPLAALLCLWANLHITTAIGIALLAFWLFETSSRRTTITAIVAAFLGTLLTPYFGGEWLTFLSKTDHPIALSSIAEFQPATVMQHPTAFLLISLAVCLTFAHACPKLLPRSHLVLVAGITLGALAVIKFLPIALLINCAVIARLWREADPQNLGQLGEAFVRLRALSLKIPYEGAAFLLICTIMLNIWPLWQAPLDTNITPVAAVDFMLDHKLPPPYLNDFGRGGYLMYRLSDQNGAITHPVAIDGRTNVTPKKIWDAAHSAFRGRQNWRDFFDAVQPNTVLWPKMSPLVSILAASNAWCLVFENGGADTGYAVFVAQEALPAGMVAQHCASTPLANPG